MQPEKPVIRHHELEIAGFYSSVPYKVWVLALRGMSRPVWSEWSETLLSADSGFIAGVRVVWH